jgi:hypothetical protein
MRRPLAREAFPISLLGREGSKANRFAIPPRVHAEPGAEGAADVVRSVDALLPSQLLQPNEIVILLIKPSIWYVLLASLWFVFCVILLLGALLTLHSGGFVPYFGRQDLIYIGAGVIGFRLFWQFLEWLSRVYVLTDRRIIRVKGVLRVQVFEARLKEITNTSLSFSVRERIFGLGTITFATAGTDGFDAAWLMIPQPLETHQVVIHAIGRYGR